jgi:hypothetical protein
VALRQADPQRLVELFAGGTASSSCSTTSHVAKLGCRYGGFRSVRPVAVMGHCRLCHGGCLPSFSTAAAEAPVVECETVAEDDGRYLAVASARR